MSIILNGDIIGLDLGMRRTGVARINTIAKIAEPLTDIDMHVQDLSREVSKLAIELNACAVVVGIPRGLDGQETGQTLWAENERLKLENSIELPIFSIDEAGTTKLAEERVKKDQSVDSVAACIILEDFIEELSRGKIDETTI